jgi:hypothetical protein
MMSVQAKYRTVLIVNSALAIFLVTTCSSVLPVWSEGATSIGSIDSSAGFLKLKLKYSNRWTDFGLTDREIVKARPTLNRQGAWNVEVEFTPTGFTKFQYLTASLVGQQFALFENDQPAFGATLERGFEIPPRCQSQLPGIFTKEQAFDLASKLNRIGGKNELKPANIPNIQSSGEVPFGQRQLDAMLAARPQMRLYVRPNDDVCNWTIKQFSDGQRRKIVWAGDVLPSVPSTIDSSVTVPENGTPIQLRLRERSDFGGIIDGEMLWARAVNEFYNARQAEANFPVLNRKAREGLIDREEYIRRVAEFEYASWVLTTKFYRNLWIPHCKKNNLPTSEIYWQTDLAPTFAQWMSQFKNPNGYPYNVYGAAFDRIRNQAQVNSRSSAK